MSSRCAAESAQPAVRIGPLAAGAWQEFVIPLAQLGIANVADLDGLWLQENAGVTQPTFFVDDVHLEFAPPPSVVNVTVNPKERIRKVDRRMFGLNAAVWDGAYASPNTTAAADRAQQPGAALPRRLAVGRLSLADQHERTPEAPRPSNGPRASMTSSQIAAATRAAVYITANYGTGTPEEAAAWVNYANKVKRHNVRYWEIGNENYGTWEADNNTRPHDPVTYATRFKEYWRQMKAVDPSIKIGAVVVTGEDAFANYTDHPVTNPRTGVVHNGWTPVMLDTLKQLGVTPDFVVYHRYEQGPGGESDLFLLNSAASWANDAAALRQMLDDYLGIEGAEGGARGHRAQLGVQQSRQADHQPRQRTVLRRRDRQPVEDGVQRDVVVGPAQRTGSAATTTAPSLYGWRRYGDYGIVNAADPAGPADRYPTFYVNKLLKYFARGGEKVVQASSDYRGLGVYAVKGNEHSLRILVINKHPSAALNTTISIPALKKGETAKLFSYGIAQDEAARTGEGSADIQQSTLTLQGSTLTFSPGPYSVHVIQLSKRERSKHDRATTSGVTTTRTRNRGQ